MSKRTVCLALVMLGGGCIHDIDEEAPAPAGRVARDCVVPAPASVMSLGAPVSLEFDGASYWLWGETWLTAPNAAGETILGNTGAVVDGVDGACRGELAFVGVDPGAGGAPAPVIALTADEQLWNEGRTDGRRLALAPLGGFVAGGAGTLYYEKVVRGPGIFDSERLGVGVCAIDAPGASCVRATPGVYEHDATLVWLGDGRHLGAPGFVDSDGRAYLYACVHAAAFEDHCVAARVRPADAADPRAYEAYNAFDGWADAKNGTVAFDGPSSVTPAYNGFLGRWVAVYADIWASEIVLRTAAAPEGEFARPSPLVHAVPPEDWFIGGGAAHAALASPGGDTLVVSYHTGADAGPPGLHLVTVELLAP